MGLKTLPMEEFRRTWSGYALVPRRPYEAWAVAGLGALAALYLYGRLRLWPALDRRRSHSLGAASGRVSRRVRKGEVHETIG